MTAMNRRLRMNFIVDARGMNVNMHVGASNVEIFFAVVPRQRRSIDHEPGATPREIQFVRKQPSTESPRERKVQVPYALVTLQTERALNLASRIKHAPHLNPLPASGARRNDAAYRVHTLEKTPVASCLPSPRSTSATRTNYLNLNAC